MVAALLLACATGGFGCGRPPPEPIELMPGRPTPTGLRRVAAPDAGVAFVRPGVRMADYTELIVDPFMLSYSTRSEDSDDPVPMLDVDTEERFKAVVYEAFVDTMRYSEGFALVDRPGPAAVRVQGWLYDFLVDDPPIEDSRNFPLCFGELSLVLTIRHSETAQPLAEIGDRVKLTCPVQPGGYATTSWRAVDRGVTEWAKRLRRWLEDLRAQPLIEG